MNPICQNDTYLIIVGKNKMSLLIRLQPKVYFTFYISQISSLPEIRCSQ
jgi:hypothetical protein